MKNADMPAMPCGEKWRETNGGHTREMSKSSLHAGLTKREMIAMHTTIGEFKFNSFNDMAEFIGREVDQSSMEDIIKASAECDAKIRTIYADALLSELEK